MHSKIYSLYFTILFTGVIQPSEPIAINDINETMTVPTLIKKIASRYGIDARNVVIIALNRNISFSKRKFCDLGIRNTDTIEIVILKDTIN